MGGIQPHSGNSYCGFYFLATTLDENQKSNFYQREYIYNKLASPLKRGGLYSVSFYISLADKSGYFSDRLAISITRKKLKFKNSTYTLLKSKRPIIVYEESKLSHSKIWEKINVTYKAQGGEQYLTIGLFDKTVTYKECENFMNKNSVSDIPGPCYYYIDDVKIEKK